ncbi:MAG: dihydroorotate dehydrogenase-like protein [Candidatus Korobacteraceae bacterium]|jgi:dihydroorotate dehydrogenase (fumarate)
MIDLSTNYLGLKLKNPVVVSASPLTEKLENFARLEDAGAAAIVMYSLMEEQIEAESANMDNALEYGTNSYAEATSYFPDMQKYHVGPDRYLELLHKGKQSVSIPVIGSLNGRSPGGWVRYSEYMEQAGADALELNIFDIPTDPSLTADDLETRYCNLVRTIRKSVRIPIAVKLGPYFTSCANFVKRLSEAGADGVVIFNRFYQPDFDIEELEVTPNLVLSSPHELRLRLHWAAILYHQVETYIAITGGVHDSTDVLKCMMAGAHVTMMTSALLKYGIEHIGVVLAGMERWMEEHEYVSVRQMRGSMSMVNVENPAAFLRGNYIKMLGSYTWREPGTALSTF